MVHSQAKNAGIKIIVLKTKDRGNAYNVLLSKKKKVVQIE